MTSFILVIVSSLISLFIIIVYYSKKRIKNIETKVYSKLLIFNILFSLFAILTFVYSKYIGDSVFIIDACQKLYLFFIIILTFLMALYNAEISQLKEKKLVTIVLSVVLVVAGLLIFISPISVINEGDLLDASGTSYNIFMLFLIIYVIFIIILAINIFIKNKTSIAKNIPFMILILLYSVALCLRTLIPNIAFESFFFTFSLLVMYFTIENPDLKLLEEYNKNKKITELNIEDKANMLFKISQDLKTPINTIKSLTRKLQKSKDLDEANNYAENINTLANNVSDIINEILDISQMDIKNIKISTQTYDTVNLFNQTLIYAKEKNKNKIEFKYNIDNNIPRILFGDQVKIKQIISSVIINAIENTEKGFVDLDVYSIVKYNICRLIIKISDSGSGMPINQINKIMEEKGELSYNDLNKLNSIDIGLKNVKKIINALGGTLLIRSVLNEGTEVIIILDQKIKSELNKYNKLEKNSYILSNKKKLLLIESDYAALKLYKKELERNGVEVITTIYGEDLIDKINAGKQFDLVLIDDEVKPTNALEIAKKIEVKDLKLVVMLNSNKEFIKEHYLDDKLFIDYLLKANYQEEIKRVIKKYLS